MAGDSARGGAVRRRRVLRRCAAIGATASALMLATGSAASQVPPSNASDTSAIAFARQMAPGWNLGNALEAIGPGGPMAKVTSSQETAWGNPVVTPALMKAVHDAGYRSIRIPVSWSQYANANGDIGKAWMERVAQVVDYARRADLFVIVNVHWDGGWWQPTAVNRAAADARFRTFWTQIATRFRDYDDHLLFAGTNEIAVKDVYTAPTAENCAVQNGFNQLFVDTVRATGGGNAGRYLVVQGYNTNIDYTVACNATMPHDPSRDRLMMEVHFYDPYDFTLNANGKIWQWGTIATDKGATQPGADEAHVDAEFEKMRRTFVAKGVPVILGEYSAIPKTEHDPAGKYRNYWDACVTRSAARHGMVPIYWDSGYVANHQSGLFDRAHAKPVFVDLIAAMVSLAK